MLDQHRPRAVRGSRANRGAQGPHSPAHPANGMYQHANTESIGEHRWTSTRNVALCYGSSEVALRETYFIRARCRPPSQAKKVTDAAAVKLEIVHSTRYGIRPDRRDRDGGEAAPDGRQRAALCRLQARAEPRGEARAYVDGFGNHVHYFNLVRPHSGLHRQQSLPPSKRGLGPGTEPSEQLVHDFIRFRSPVKEVDGCESWHPPRHRRFDFARIGRAPRSTELTLTISREFTYDRTGHHVYSSVDESSSCAPECARTSRHLFIAAARAIGRAGALTERLHLHSPGEKISTASHAWGEAWVEGRGWIGSMRPIGAGHAAPCRCGGTDYTDAAPTPALYVVQRPDRWRVSVKTGRSN